MAQRRLIPPQRPGTGFQFPHAAAGSPPGINPAARARGHLRADLTLQPLRATDEDGEAEKMRRRLWGGGWGQAPHPLRSLLRAIPGRWVLVNQVPGEPRSRAGCSEGNREAGLKEKCPFLYPPPASQRPPDFTGWNFVVQSCESPEPVASPCAEALFDRQGKVWA